MILAALACATGQIRVHFSAITVASLALQTVVFSFLSLLVWLPDETLQSSFIVGSVLVGIVVVSGHDLLRLRMASLVKD